jgi:hypothetical protein
MWLEQQIDLMLYEKGLGTLSHYPSTNLLGQALQVELSLHPNIYQASYFSKFEDHH